ncbi:4Fe-4S dicluster domain-containing protein [uncultured Mailhella sp.]|uniref:4Fe-4S dicluster domain-containing protein n=1 Tax=uncultured Mailhella sp. TaxID=1981031 RepID=UPI00262E4C3A|nr:4Fe-4S dicluster domain-containing protein [uncultured Mailhella sp.]
MKQYFQMIKAPRFRLVHDEHRPLSDGPAPRRIRLNREGFSIVPGIRKKTLVCPGMLLAEYPTLDKGDLHAPIYGTITEINARSIFVDAADPAAAEPGAFPEPPAPADLLQEGTEGEALVQAVKRLGVNTRSLGRRIRTLIVNALNPEPGVCWAEPMLSEHADVIQAGLQLLRRFGRAEELLLAVPRGAKVSFPGVTTVEVEPMYPNSVNELLIREVTGEEAPPDVAAVGLHNVWSLGRVGTTGLPLMETVITIGTAASWANTIVKNGSLVGELLEFANVSLKSGDTLLRGGPLRGESLDRLDRSITKGSYGFFVVNAGEVPPIEGDSPCINCGACIQACPTRIDPRMLSRHAEFGKYDTPRRENFRLCVDCGLCGYVCIARRPVLQYIRLAIKKLEAEERLARLTPIEPAGKA